MKFTARLRRASQPRTAFLRRGRQPFVPCNGILTLLPFDVIERGPGEALEIQRAIREDLAAFVRSAMVRCPVAALVSHGSEPGFRELVRRVGTDRAAAQRFGKGYSVWSPPVAEQLEAVAAHACGAFEDWVYSLFREADGFNKPGNTKVYQLLCKIRSHLAGRLKAILVNGFAADSHHEPTATTALAPQSRSHSIVKDSHACAASGMDRLRAWSNQLPEF